MIKRILVGLGGTPYTTSEVRHALDLARAHEAEITAVTIIDLRRVSQVGPMPIGASAAAASLVNFRIQITQKAVDDAVDLFQETCRKEGITAEVISEAGDPFEELIRVWRYHDMTVLSLQSLFEYGVVHDPKDIVIQLIAKGVRPILAVAKDYRRIKRVLIAYNGSMESAKAMKQFVQMRLWPEADVHIAAFDLPATEAKVIVDEALTYMRAHQIDVQTHIDPGDPNDRLLALAHDLDADLVVMGATARARIFRRLLGDTALQMVRHSDLPLFMTQ